MPVLRRELIWATGTGGAQKAISYQSIYYLIQSSFSEINTMGNSQPKVDIDTVGFRVLGVQPQSPAEQVGLVSFFDFIVAVNGVPLKILETSFINIIKVIDVGSVLF